MEILEGQRISWNVVNPATAETLARVPLGTQGGCRCRRPRRRRRVSRLAPHAARRSHPVSLQAEAASRRPSRGARANLHHGERQDARGIARRAAPRHRERGSGLRNSHADAGLQPRRRRQRHRRDDDPPAAGRDRGDRAVQFSGDDSVLVSALRHRLRQHVHPEALGEGSAHVAARFRADGGAEAARRRGEYGSRRKARGGCAARASGSARDQLCGLHAGREVYLRARRRCTESACSARAARRITFWCCTMRISRRPRASSATARSAARASAAWRFRSPWWWATRRRNSRSPLSDAASAIQRGQWARRVGADGSGDHQREQVADRKPDRQGRKRRRESAARRPLAATVRATGRQGKFPEADHARQRSRRTARFPTRRFSARC